MEVSGFDNFLGWRFDDFSGLVFSCGFGFVFDDFFMFWRFRWRIGILYEILHCYGFDSALVLGLIVLGFGKNMKNKFLCSYLLKINESNNNNKLDLKVFFSLSKKSLFFFLNLFWIKLKLKYINYFYFLIKLTWLFSNLENARVAFKKYQIKYFISHINKQCIPFAISTFSVTGLTAWTILKTIFKNQGLT